MNVNEAEPVDTSTRLAFDRTRLAYDRTMMAWIRTATSLITFGFSVFKFFEFQAKTPRADLLLGPRGFAIIMICVGLISLLMATIQHRFERNKLRSMDREVPRSMAAALAGVIAALGIAALISVILNR
jgi:putative membrane protein